MIPLQLSDAELARAIAGEAGDLLLAIRAEEAPGRARGDRGDREANALILARLAEHRPADAILSEEAADDRLRCDVARVWIVDPLDGTREYAEDRDDWAVHVALAIDGKPDAGAVAVPARGELFCTAGCAPLPPAASRPRMVVSRSRAPALAARIAAAIGAEIVPMGSAGAKAMAVVEGRAEIYLHSGGQHEWDNCAPVAVALAAGLHASRLDGTPIVYNCHDTMVHDLLICRPEFAAAIIALAKAEGVARWTG